MSAHLEQLKKDFSAKLAETIELLKLAERAVVQDENSEKLKSEVLNSFESFDAAIIRFENFCDYVPVEGSEQVEEVAPAKKSLDLDAE